MLSWETQKILKLERLMRIEQAKKLNTILGSICKDPEEAYKYICQFLDTTNPSYDVLKDWFERLVQKNVSDMGIYDKKTFKKCLNRACEACGIENEPGRSILRIVSSPQYCQNFYKYFYYNQKVIEIVANNMMSFTSKIGFNEIVVKNLQKCVKLFKRRLQAVDKYGGGKNIVDFNRYDVCIFENEYTYDLNSFITLDEYIPEYRDLSILIPKLAYHLWTDNGIDTNDDPSYSYLFVTKDKISSFDQRRLCKRNIDIRTLNIATESGYDSIYNNLKKGYKVDYNVVDDWDLLNKSKISRCRYRKHDDIQISYPQIVLNSLKNLLFNSYSTTRCYSPISYILALKVSNINDIYHKLHRMIQDVVYLFLHLPNSKPIIRRVEKGLIAMIEYDFTGGEEKDFIEAYFVQSQSRNKKYIRYINYHIADQNAKTKTKNSAIAKKFNNFLEFKRIINECDLQAEWNEKEYQNAFNFYCSHRQKLKEKIAPTGKSVVAFLKVFFKKLKESTDKLSLDTNMTIDKKFNNTTAKRFKVK